MPLQRKVTDSTPKILLQWMKLKVRQDLTIQSKTKLNFKCENNHNIPIHSTHLLITKFTIRLKIFFYFLKIDPSDLKCNKKKKNFFFRNNFFFLKKKLKNPQQ